MSLPPCVPNASVPKARAIRASSLPALRSYFHCKFILISLISPSLPPPPKTQQTETELQWTSRSDVYEYGSAANPEMAPIPVLVHPPTLHESGPTRVIPFDIDDYLEIDSQVRIVLRVSQIQALFYRSW